MPCDEWKTDFLASLALVPNVAEACRQAGVTRAGAYLARESDPLFKGAWDDALAEGVDELAGAAYKSALAGNTALVVFLLKSHRREVYGDKVQADVTTKGERVSTVFYIPENGRDAHADAPPGPGGPPAAGPPGDVPVGAG